MQTERIAKQNTSLSQQDCDIKILDPLGDGISSIELIRIAGSDVDVVNAARVSHGKMVSEISERDKKLISFLLEHKHTSPFEHNQLSFRIKCPIFVARQWMRHRMNSYNEISYRYVKVPFEFYIPTQWRYQSASNRQATEGSFTDEQLLQAYKKSIECAVQTYEQLIEAGVGREIARGVMPVCTYTQFIFTCNLHSFMHFLNLRIKDDAQYEIRQYAQGMLQLAQDAFPVSLGEWKKHFYKS